MKLVNETPNGRLSFCKCCDLYQLEFGNILFSFPKASFSEMQAYIGQIDGETYVKMNKHMSFNRKIFLEFPVKSVFFCLNTNELEELKVLLFIKKKEKAIAGERELGQASLQDILWN